MRLATLSFDRRTHQDYVNGFCYILFQREFPTWLSMAWLKRATHGRVIEIFDIFTCWDIWKKESALEGAGKYLKYVSRKNRGAHTYIYALVFWKKHTWSFSSAVLYIMASREGSTWNVGSLVLEKARIVQDGHFLCVFALGGLENKPVCLEEFGICI